MGLNIHSAYSAGELTVYLSGELDHHEARAAMKFLDDLLEEYLPRSCVLDFSALHFMDSSGIALIIRMQRKATAILGKLSIVNPAAQPRRVMEAAGIERMVCVTTGGAK